MIFVSATPGPTSTSTASQVVEQVIRPTGLIDPAIAVQPTKGQIDDLLGEINQPVARGERVLVTTLTKRMAEDLADYLKEMGVRTHYLHSNQSLVRDSALLKGISHVSHTKNLLRKVLKRVFRLPIDLLVVFVVVHSATRSSIASDWAYIDSTAGH